MSLLRAAEEDGGYRRKGKRARYRSDVLKLSRVIFVFPRDLTNKDGKSGLDEMIYMSMSFSTRVERPRRRMERMVQVLARHNTRHTYNTVVI